MFSVTHPARAAGKANHAKHGARGLGGATRTASDNPHRRTPPPPRQCAVPLLRCAGADERQHSRGAASHPTHANHHAQEKNRGRRSAERRMPSIVRAFANKSTRYAPLVCCADARQTGRAAFRRFAANSPRQSQPAWLSPRPCFLTGSRGCHPPSPVPVQRAPRRPVFLPDQRCPGPPGSGVQIRTRAPHPAPLPGLPRESDPRMSDILYLVLETETNVNEKGTRQARARSQSGTDYLSGRSRIVRRHAVAPLRRICYQKLSGSQPNSSSAKKKWSVATTSKTQRELRCRIL